MKDGFIKVAAGSPALRPGDCGYNAGRAITLAGEMAAAGAKIIVLPELCLTGYTCGDLFWQETLLRGAEKALLTVAAASERWDALVFVGLPVEFGGKLYNAAAAVNRGHVLGLVPKSYIPNYNEFYEGRHFSSGIQAEGFLNLGQQEVPFSTNLVFTCQQMPRLAVAAEICEDLWAPDPPSVRHVLRGGANLIVNLSASNEVIGKDAYRAQLVSAQSARLVCGYVYTSAGVGESTQDVVFGGHQLIGENGAILASARRFAPGAVYAEVDIHRLDGERRRLTTFRYEGEGRGYTRIPFRLEQGQTVLTRRFDPHPFVPDDPGERGRRCEEILTIQSVGLATRLERIGCRRAVIGLSGGLDSTLALLVTARAFDRLGLPRGNILAVTMPCFGTTDRTYRNACGLSQCLGATLREIPIREAVNLHFRDIGHDPEKRDVTYENAQARERTQILMDLANQEGGIVVGTGDLSELALGWATYNGDHMSMYGVNASVPKTLVRHLVDYCAAAMGDSAAADVLRDILDTPVSPELLPPKDGAISQRTEELVGPYELHDFFLYYLVRWGFPPRKIYRLALLAFAGEFDSATILKWLRVFCRRFFAQQYKRSCLPDGPKVGSVALSPRGDLRMPSDASPRLWLEELDNIEV